MNAPARFTWKGLPVECGQGCGAHGVPVATEDGWRLPVHSMQLPTGERVHCPGSLRAVEP
ncbi:hypothetical protein I5G62_gp67 [Mycobacterium phage CRB2]|uniref:Uncharacterized protein n=1 Tax=Mycobacterium phage CRB2 TaxID=2483623 RepID=A0A455LNB7_9CAUD|nr:hypothetical protein I5G62_gp67 [Mycobacterium phage CRB2]AYP70053.1 hypothetical protein CRB2_67 [Mycobacterium phage CRB2]